jgi:hypothetical protein
MIKITLDNYEEYVNGWIEGSLPESEQQAFGQFLVRFPDIRAELNELTSFILEKETSDAPVPSFDHLKRNLNEKIISKDNFLEFVMASMDEELDLASEQMLTDFLVANPRLKMEANLFSQCSISPDTSIRFPGKSALRRAIPMVPFIRRQWVQWTAMAASIAFLVGIFLLNPLNDNEIQVVKPDPAALAQNEPVSRHSIIPGQRIAVSRVKVTDTASFAAVAEDSSAHKIVPATFMASSFELPEKGRARYAGSLPGLAELSVRPGSSVSPVYSASHIPGSNMGSHRLTIQSFPVEQIRYFTGGGNEKPGLLADLSLSRIADATNAYDLVNTAGQNLYIRWQDWKEQTLDAVIPFR